MEWIPVIAVIGIAVLLFGGKRFAPKIINQGKEGADAWLKETKKAFDNAKKEDEVNGEEQ